MARMRNLLSMHDLSGKSILKFVKLGKKVKRNPGKYENKLRGKTLLMVFAKPSLRTHLSFDVAMHQLGGHAIFYDMRNSTLGEKESIKDFGKVVSRYVDIIMARLYEHEQIVELARHADVPVINGLTDWYHPCQILGDFLTIKEKFGKLKGLRLAYIGDANNNVTHDLIIGTHKVGMDMVVSCPDKKSYMPNAEAIRKLPYEYQKNPKVAVMGADVVYTDTWMSYQISKTKEKQRARELEDYRVTMSLMNKAHNKARFMHNLPAHRGHEVTDEVMDSKASVVYDQAENRAWAQKAVLLKLLGKA